MKRPATLILRTPLAVQVILLAAIYFAVAKTSLLLAIPPGYATAVWPPSGIALAALLILGNRVWPGVWLGAALVNFTINSSPLAALFIGSGNTLEALAGAALVQRFVGVPYDFKSGEDVVKFVALAALSSTIAATIAVSSLAMLGSVPWPGFLANWWTWWQGDATGIIIMTPLILSWATRRNIAWTKQKKLEGFYFGLLLLITTGLIFGPAAEHLAPFSLAFVTLPFIIWAAFRFSQREVTTAIAVVCAIAVCFTLRRRDLFGAAALNDLPLVLLAFVGTVVTTGLVLGAVLGERSRAVSELGKALQDLKEQAITDPLTGLYNLRYLREFLPREMIRVKRRDGSLAVIMIDIDHFKQINDNHGHDAGDYVLKQVSILLKRHVRGGDIVCRYGGEELVLVLADSTPEGALRRAGDIREAIQRAELVHRDRKSTRLNSSHIQKSRMPSSA